MNTIKIPKPSLSFNTTQASALVGMVEMGTGVGAVVPMNALLRQRGHSLMGAGRSIISLQS
jgi:hypothetical protein